MKNLSTLLALPLAAALTLSASGARADLPPCNPTPDPNCSQELLGKLCPDKASVCVQQQCGGPSGMQQFICQTPCDVAIDDPGAVCGDPTQGGDKAAVGKACGDKGTCGFGICTKGSPVVRCYQPGALPPEGGGGAGGSAGSGGAGEAGAGAGGSAAGQAGSGTAGSGTAGSGAAGAGTAGSGAAGAGTAGAAGSAAGAAGAAGASDDSSCAVAVAGAGRQGMLAGLMLALGAAALLIDRRRR